VLAARISVDPYQLNYRRSDRVRPHRRTQRDSTCLCRWNGAFKTRSRRAWCIQYSI